MVSNFFFDCVKVKTSNLSLSFFTSVKRTLFDSLHVVAGALMLKKSQQIDAWVVLNGFFGSA